MPIEIKHASQNDMPQVLELVKEQALYHEEEENVVETDAAIFKEYALERDELDCFVAKEEDVVVGIAVCYKTFSTWKGLSYHLDELIVTEEARGVGLGKKLFKYCQNRANEIGAAKFDWIVHKRNANAIGFYEKQGAEIDKDWYIGKLSLN